MSVFRLLDSREHVMVWDEKVPEKRLIEKLLWQAWKVTPSKQNFMPYSIAVLGPDKEEEKTKLKHLSMLNKKMTNERTHPGHTEEGHNINFSYEGAPYILVYSQRAPCKPNPYIQNMVDNENDFYEQMHDTPIHLRGMIRTTALEVGLFAGHLSTLALEQGLRTNYICCFPNEVEDWHPLPIIKHKPLLIQCIGYCKHPRRNARSYEHLVKDTKPQPEELITWI